MKPSLTFFGTPDYSLLVLKPLIRAGYHIAIVVTKPPRPVGRNQFLSPTPVAQWSRRHKLPLITPAADNEKPWLFADAALLTTQVLKYEPDLIITADYTQKISPKLIKQVKFGGLNVHPSLLPAYRGPAPVPWAILNGETETGVSIVTLAEKFDAGQVIAQEKELILTTDTTSILLTRLFAKGGELLLKTLPSYIANPNRQLTTPKSQPSYFPRLNRDTGFELWEKIQTATTNRAEAERIERKWRALHPWPGLWTKIKSKVAEKRLKILKVHLEPSLVLDEVQFEGKKPVKVTSLPAQQLFGESDI